MVLGNRLYRGALAEARMRSTERQFAMRLFRSGIVALLMVAVIVSGMVSSAGAAHNGNNRAEVSGTAADMDATGKAVVNYSEGRGTFNGTITVRNLEPGETYTFQVSGAAAGAAIDVCEGTANSQGTFSCSFQNMALPGFANVEVENEAGVVIATGMFERGGNCRDADQAGSLCDAPGRN